MTAQPVDWTTLKLRPIATCDDCGWQPMFYGRETLDAKAHARANPGHRVLVERITRSVYSTPVEAGRVQRGRPVYVHEDAISYSPIVLDDALNRATWEVRIEFAGYGDDGMERWAIRNMGRCLGTSGEWDQEPIPSYRADEWLAEHRFTRHQAARLASEVCHDVTWNGRTADQVAAERVQ